MTAITLVLIPGLMNDDWVWSMVRPVLAPLADIHIPDLRGLDSLSDMAARVLADTAGPLAVAGHSMGGRVALEMVRAAPDRIARLAILDSGSHGPTEAERPGRLRLVDIAREQGMAAVAREWMPPMLAAHHRNDPALVAGITAMLERCSPEDFARQQHALLTRPDATPLLATIACPTLLIAGSEDEWSPPAQQQAIAAHIARAQVKLVERAGHMLPVEEPQALAPILREWLQG